MKYMANTIENFILAEAKNKTGTFKFILPSYPSGLLLTLGKRLAEEFSRVVGHRVRFIYGVAYRLGKEWHDHGTSNDRTNFKSICQSGWYNSDNNLTNLRNELRKPDEDCLVIVLAGYDHIDDQGSLLDFFHLDQQTIWNLCLKKSFKGWVLASLQTEVDQVDGASEIDKIAELFSSLYEYGLTDLLGVSIHLESLDFTGMMSSDDAYLHLLSNLINFKLPCMIGLAGSRVGRKGIGSYIAPALEFFNYSRFLEQGKRKTALKKIEQFRAIIDSEQIDSRVLGDFKSPTALLDTLKDYIENRSPNACELLKTADFIFIHNRILNYKPRKNEPAPVSKKASKIYGLPPQVFLRAMWITLGEFKKNLRERSVLAGETLSKITLQSTLFRHDFDAGEENDNGDGDQVLARNFLNQVLGGIDELLKNQIQLELGADKNKRTVAFDSYICPGEENSLLQYSKTKIAEPTFRFEVKVSGHDGYSTKREFLWALPQNHQSRLLKNLFNLTYQGYVNNKNVLPVFAIPYMSEVFKARDEDELNRLLHTALKKDFTMVDLLGVPDIDSGDRVKNLLIELSVCYQMFLQQFEQSGFFCALEHGYESLRRAFEIAYIGYSTFAGRKMKPPP